MALCAGIVSCGACGEPPPVAPPNDDDAGTPVPSGRCDYPLEDFLALSGTGARVLQIASDDQLIGGPSAAGRVGDWLIENDRVRIVIQGISRAIGPQPYGGTIIDADLVREGPGRDQFGEIGLLTHIGRTYDPTLFEILADGSGGGPAILAVSGPDIENDYLSLRTQLELVALPATDPWDPLSLQITQYFILPPGEQRLHVVTALCNVGTSEVLTSVGDLADPGDKLEFFNGLSCTGGFGYSGGEASELCVGVDRMSWFGLLGDGVAYGYAPYKPGSPTLPEIDNVMLVISGVTGILHGAPGIDGLLAWFDPKAEFRRGEMRIPPGARRATARDFVVGRDLGEVASIIQTTRSAATRAAKGAISGRVTSGGVALAGARVSVRDGTTLATVFTTDAEGRYSGTLAAKTYGVSAWADGRVPTVEQEISLGTNGTASADFELPLPREVTVSVTEARGGAIPAKVTVLCASGVCPARDGDLNRFTSTLHDPLPDGVAKIVLVPPSGTTRFVLPPGQYRVVVSRGPEYSLWPNDFSSSGGAVLDLRQGDAVVDAVLARVLDTTGWMSADFHVHAVGSPDSNVDNGTRVVNFAAEGVDVLVSTDHDFVTDFRPWVEAAGAQNVVSTVIGEEVSTLDYGHYNLFPITRTFDDPTFGAVDWAGGREPTLRPSQIFSEGRKRGAKTIHFNHPRGFLGGFSHVRVDTDTLATHADPATFRMAPDPYATPGNTRLLSSDFNALEVLNVADDEFDFDKIKPLLNDWFTLLSRGLPVSITGVSDTHRRNSKTGGYYRTYVNMRGADTPAQFDELLLSSQLNARAATATSAPFVTMRAVRVDGSGVETSPPAGIGETLAPSSAQHAIKLSIDVQVPDYLDITKIELFMHQPQDDARCPLTSNDPRATTTRVACNGVANHNWPASGVTATRTIALDDAQDLQAVLTEGGVTYRRYRLVEDFELPAPTRDNWVVAIVSGSKSLFPLLFLAPRPGKPSTPTFPFAVTNPIYIDADGNGFDRPPFDPDSTGGVTLPVNPVKPRPGALGVPGRQDFLDAWGERFHLH